MPPWELAALPRRGQPTRGTQGPAGCSAGTGASCLRLRLPLPPLRPWATCPAASERWFLPCTPQKKSLSTTEETRGDAQGD